MTTMKQSTPAARRRSLWLRSLAILAVLLVAGIAYAADADGDGIADGPDNCPTVANAGQENQDGDSFGDACDKCPALSSANNTDGDGDGFGDVCDKCPAVADPGQLDGDNDGVG